MLTKAIARTFYLLAFAPTASRASSLPPSCACVQRPSAQNITLCAALTSPRRSSTNPCSLAAKCFKPADDGNLWERTCPRRQCVRRDISTECTGLFVDKSTPTTQCVTRQRSVLDRVPTRGVGIIRSRSHHPSAAAPTRAALRRRASNLPTTETCGRRLAGDSVSHATCQRLS
ncbi:hypothetical protein SAMN05216593_11017 [Pseudomonas asturiensis]|uniref:Secreted protein n=1 Tax=Pseudomonas asturiensis TaxID=1190415 RepID=A0A1M7PE63_9PSED|nr:hypothetical protein SAMN05216593_11017 [Pseudomonas asturiensis]